MKKAEKIANFQKTVWDFYRKNKRAMPWRETKDPYNILVSEVMLQQTQVARVMVKYPEFIKEFPTLRALARAPLSRVLSVWQGMGYNRRAKYLKETAEVVVREHGGKIPQNRDALLALPGIGQSTAGALVAFAFNEPVVFIETNIRRVFIYHFFSHAKEVCDKDVLCMVKETLDHKRPRAWYYALFDYGTYLAETLPNPNRKSRHYTKQSKFEGSHRQLRGRVLKYLLAQKKASILKIQKDLKIKKGELGRILTELEKEQFIEKSAHIYSCR